MTSRTARVALLSTCLVLTSVAPPAAAIGETITITNIAPTVVVSGVTGLTAGALDPTSGTTSTITVTLVVTDLNGASDVTGATAGILKADGTTVHLAQAAATLSSTGATTKTFTKTLAMNYYDAPATYKVKVVGTDAASATGDNLVSLTSFTFNSLVAMSAPSTFAVAGSGIAPGSTAAAQSLTVTNAGNAQIDTQVSATDLTFSGNTIPVGSIAYSLSSDMSASAALTTSATGLSSFDLNYGAGSTKSIYFQVTAPTALPPGDYTGTLTVTAVAG